MDSISKMIRATLDAVRAGGDLAGHHGPCAIDSVAGAEDIGLGAEVYPALLAELRGLRAPNQDAAKLGSPLPWTSEPAARSKRSYGN